MATGSQRLPSCVPITPPTSTATIHTGKPAGSAAKVMVVPARPAIEFTRMKTTEIPDVRRVRAHPVNSSVNAAIAFEAVEQEPRAFVRHPHLARGGRDRAGIPDAFEGSGANGDARSI